MVWNDDPAIQPATGNRRGHRVVYVISTESWADGTVG